MTSLNEHIGKDGFRLRGAALSRIDGFSDVVFGFALTLIVASLEVPKTYAELHEVLLGFFPFAICFVFLIMVWWSHFRFFRRYGLHDVATILLNSLLLFMVLFYVYPLKFLFTLVTMQAMHHLAQAEAVFTSPFQIREMMTVYGFGFAATYFCLSALYFNAWRLRKHLHLNPLETTLTLSYAWDDFGVACVGLICVAVARMLPPGASGTAGFCFFLIGVWKTIHGVVAGKRIKASEARTDMKEPLSLSTATEDCLPSTDGTSRRP